jgi:very-short-patch-repair endonuclease
VDRDELLALAARVPTTGRAACLRVAAEADSRAANPFESVLRAIALDAGLRLAPQEPIRDRGFTGRPDLVDPERRLVLEADSFEFHGTRKALHRDCRRYTALALRGWMVLRFSWEDVMLEPSHVRACLLAAVDPSRLGPRGRAALLDSVA